MCAISATEPGSNRRQVILGIDPGLRRTGFGVIAWQQNRMTYLASGVIVTGDEDLPVRLGIIFDGISEVLDTYQPDLATIEKVFVNVNPQSTLLLGQARGAAIAALTTRKLSVHEYTALQLKKSVTGHGHADKHQVQAMVMRLLNLPSAPSADAADALACAICHVNSHGLADRLTAQTPAGSRRLRVRGGRLV